MKLKIFSFLVLDIIFLSRAQNNNQTKTCKINKDADTCLMNLLLLGDPKYVFPLNTTQMSDHCKLINSHERCIKDYSSKCLASFPRQVTSVLAYGVAKTNKGYCTNRKRRDQFIAIGKCANQMKNEGDACMQQFIDNLLGIENYPQINMRIPIACCNFHRMKTCMIKNAENAGKAICNDSNLDEIDRIIDGYSVDVLNLLCGEYTEDSDKCVKLLPKTPKSLSTQKKPKSMLPPLINILSSVPQF